MSKMTSIIIVLIISTLVYAQAHAIANRRAIQWTAPPDVFVTSLYLGVLGRQPAPEEVAHWVRFVDDTAGSRIKAFWGFVGSHEYRSPNRPWYGSEKTWWTLRGTYQYKKEDGRTDTCNCYTVSKTVRTPHIRVGPSDKKSHQVAMAVANYKAIFDIKACGGDCGIPPELRNLPANARVRAQSGAAASGGGGSASNTNRGSQSGTKRFNYPQFAGYPLDWCYKGGSGCGDMAANEFCKTNGFSQAKDFKQNPDIGDKTPTWQIGAPKHWKPCSKIYCDGFKYIICK